MAEAAVPPPSSVDPKTQSLLRASAKRTRSIFAADFGSLAALSTDLSERASVAARIRSEYEDVRELPPALAAKQANAASTVAARRKKQRNTEDQPSDPKMAKLIEDIPANSQRTSSPSNALTVRATDANGFVPPNANGPTPQRNLPSSSLVRRDVVRQQKPEWHAPWKLMRVISGHLGWVRALAVEPGNQWFASGRVIAQSRSGTLHRGTSNSH